MFRWLKDKGVTAIITGERGDGRLTRHGLEEYVSDCVILLDHRVTEQVSTRRMRIVKYRGTTHGTNEFPFLIDADGISVVPITSAGMDHPATEERISSGVPSLDDMLDGKGYYRGSSVLISGTAGTGKTSIAAHFAVAACERGERRLFFSFEEAQTQLVRNLRSIGLDLGQWIKKGQLVIQSARPTLYGLEMHLATLHKSIAEFKPHVVVADPISNFIAAGTMNEAGSMLIRLVDYLKSEGITSLFTNLTQGGSFPEQTDVGISSIIDTWLLLRDIEQNGQRQGLIYILKSRGMPHSKQVRKLQITSRGIEFAESINGIATIEHIAPTALPSRTGKGGAR